MIPKIKKIQIKGKYFLQVDFYDGKQVIYDLAEDIKQLTGYSDLANIPGLFEKVQLDASKTCVYWNDYIDLPSDIIYEYGTPAKTSG